MSIQYNTRIGSGTGTSPVPIPLPIISIPDDFPRSQSGSFLVPMIGPVMF